MERGVEPAGLLMQHRLVEAVAEAILELGVLPGRLQVERVVLEPVAGLAAGGAVTPWRLAVLVVWVQFSSPPTSISAAVGVVELPQVLM